MKLFKILALIALTSACAPAYISISGSIPPEIQQNIAPAFSESVYYSINHQQSNRELTFSIAPLWDITTNVSSPLESALSELIENKFPDISNKSENRIIITVHEISHSVSRSGPNPSAIFINVKITVDIYTPKHNFSRLFRHKATIAVIGQPGPFFLRTQQMIQSMILKFVIDLDKFIQASKI